MEALIGGNTEIAPSDLRITMNKLARAPKSPKETGFAKEFKVLLSLLHDFKRISRMTRSFLLKSLLLLLLTISFCYVCICFCFH